MLKLCELTKTYSNDDGARQVVLDAINLDVPDNQFCCLLGASGCSKTTLLRIVAGLTQADGGEVTIAGQAVHGPGQDRSMVFQNHGLLPW
jgi:ABC-type nitrate/sulfonate/bicarbonate transport system ATPase subunit